ncbi:type II secretion system protein N [Vibrio palustris]|uniref:Type II secretion system protein N n=1 Tax=Vibrio palustris TaxID=1918946 RepID=A0A1R4B786_9VIBR|nr:type II secretion system protein N [Vibrio palustris]SJL84783.1 Type II secretion system protein N [Vibrio palustris]
MKLKISFIALFVSVFLVSAIVHLPAALVLKFVSIPPQLQIAGVSGSVWNGHASQVHWQNQGLGALDWDISLAALFAGNIEATTRFGRGSAVQLHGRGVVGYGFNGAYAKNLIVSLPARHVLQYSPQPLPVSVKGQLELSLKEFYYAKPWCKSATGSLVWSGASMTTPVSPLKLGQVVAKLSCEENRVAVQGTQKTAQVSSSFSVTLNQPSNYKVTSWFKPEAEFPAELAKWLKRLPDPDGQGRYHFNRSGQF